MFVFHSSQKTVELCTVHHYIIAGTHRTIGTEIRTIIIAHPNIPDIHTGI